MDSRVADFAGLLRTNGVRVSPAEVADAVVAAALVGVDDRAVFRSALRASLVKRARDVPVFDALFDLYFSALGRVVEGVEQSLLAALAEQGLLEGDELEMIVRTLAELLTVTPGWTPPDLTGLDVLAQPHCHHHAVMGWAADERLLGAAGVRLTRVGGCCGLAGNWGVERGRHDMSVAVAQTRLLPAVRAAGADAVLLADGFSCRTQLDDLAGRRGVHVAELLAAAVRGGAAQARRLKR